MSKLNKFIFAAFCLISATVCAAEKPAAPIKATVDKASVETGERIVYTLTINGEFDNPQIDVPKFTDFEVVARNQSQGYSLINGKGNINFTLIYGLSPTKPGTFTIEGAVLKTKTGTLKTDPIVITVTGKPLEEKSKITPYIEKGTDL